MPVFINKNNMILLVIYRQNMPSESDTCIKLSVLCREKACIIACNSANFLCLL